MVSLTIPVTPVYLDVLYAMQQCGVWVCVYASLVVTRNQSLLMSH